MFLEYLEFVAIIHGYSSLTRYPNQISQVNVAFDVIPGSFSIFLQCLKNRGKPMEPSEIETETDA